MKFPMLGKVASLCTVMVALVVGLQSIGGVVSERQGRQFEAEQSVADGLAGPQTMLGPLLQRSCEATWQQMEGEGKERKLVTSRSQFTLTLWPRSLSVSANASIQPRYRGLFKLNSYLAKTHLLADWSDLSGLMPVPEHPGSHMQCGAPTVTLAVGDARGIQAASIQAGGQALTVLPGSLMKSRERGLHAILSGADKIAYDAPLHLDIALELSGFRSVAWVPVGDDTRVHLTSDWPHPSFAGRFLPVERKVDARGFESQWQVSSLATTARQEAENGVRLCQLNETGSTGRDTVETDPKTGCVDSFGVSFIDPVNGYVLSDRALKYGLLFIALTFVGVGLVEIMRQVRVHPVQYLLVGCALTLFFLLLVSLTEHVPFAWAYLAASLACGSLLTFYAMHILKGIRPGLVFGVGVGLLYGTLYALLQMEQTALVLGSILLFVILSAIMVATRRLDWYALTARMRATAAQPTPDALPPAAPVSPGDLPAHS